MLKSVKSNNKRYMNPKFFSKALIKKMKCCKASFHSSTNKSQKSNITTTIVNTNSSRSKKDKQINNNNVTNSFIQSKIVSFIIPSQPPIQIQQPQPQPQPQQPIQIQQNTNYVNVIPILNYKATIQLIPFDNQTTNYMEQCQYNPLLEITCGSTKPISLVTNHLHKKWNRLNGYILTLLDENAKELGNINNLLNTLPNHNNVIRLYYMWSSPSVSNTSTASAVNNNSSNKQCNIRNKPVKRIKPTLIAHYLNSENQKHVIGFVQAPTVFNLPYATFNINQPVSIVDDNNSLMQLELNPFIEDDLLTIPEINRFPILDPETHTFSF